MTASIPAAWILFSTASAWHNKAPVKQLIGRLAMGAQQGRSWLYAVHDRYLRYTERYTTHKGDFDISQFSDMSDTSDISYYLTCICSYHCGQALQLNKTIHHIQFAKITHSPAQHNALRSSKYKTLAAEEVRSYRCRVTQCHTYVIHLESELIRWVSCAARLISTADMQDISGHAGHACRTGLNRMPGEQPATVGIWILLARLRQHQQAQESTREQALLRAKSTNSEETQQETLSANSSAWTILDFSRRR